MILNEDATDMNIAAIKTRREVTGLEAEAAEMTANKIDFEFKAHTAFAALSSAANIGFSAGKLFPVRYAMCQNEQCDILTHNLTLTLLVSAVDFVERMLYSRTLCPEGADHEKNFLGSGLGGQRRLMLKAAQALVNMLWTALCMWVAAASAPSLSADTGALALGAVACLAQPALVLIDVATARRSERLNRRAEAERKLAAARESLQMDSSLAYACC